VSGVRDTRLAAYIFGHDRLIRIEKGKKSISDLPQYQQRGEPAIDRTNDAVVYTWAR
jgi:hypothetical protein